MGKAYANRKSMEKRPESDFYETPKSLTRELLNKGDFDYSLGIWEPAKGNGAILDVLRENKIPSDGNDLKFGYDFLEDRHRYSQIITNPPFSNFDLFVLKAKVSCNKFAFIAKLNFFGAYERNERGIWDNLSKVYIFNRQVDYRTPSRNDGLFHVGNLVTGWFIWDSKHDSKQWKTEIMDVQKYAKLGQFNDN